MRKGYAKIGVPAAEVPDSSEPSASPFRASMRGRVGSGARRSEGRKLGADLLPHDPRRRADRRLQEVERHGEARRDRRALHAEVKLLGVEIGRGQTNTHGDGIERFGYVDGRSQPLLVVEDIAAEPHTPAGRDPTFALGRVLVRDSAAPDPARHFGSFFVFRKFEQNVRRFHQAE